MNAPERNTATIDEAIAAAEAILPGVASPDDEDDPRWQAIIEVGNYLDEEPEKVWSFIERWGGHEDWDLRAAIATCLLEHLLEDHFKQFFPRVEERVRRDALFADMFLGCGEFGQSKAPRYAKRFQSLQEHARTLEWR